jgi:hypothetical protein
LDSWMKLTVVMSSRPAGRGAAALRAVVELCLP